MSPSAFSNGACLDAEIRWFTDVVDARMSLHCAGVMDDDLLRRLPPPLLDGDSSPYATTLNRARLEPAERLVVILALLPEIKPSALDPFLLHNTALQRRFTEFGGALSEHHPGFLPTRETALFLLAGDQTDARLHYHDLFTTRGRLTAQRFLQPPAPGTGGGAKSAILQLTADCLDLLTTGALRPRAYDADFPAHPISTTYEWADVVLAPAVRREVEDVIAWCRNESVLMTDWRLSTRIKPGYRVLLHGPPGTGKTLTACLIGKTLNKPIYRVDLSRLVSKYIGETEKNLAALFDHSMGGDIVLFFDEADSLFGRRTESRNANDRAANQQTAYLLQRIEDFPGLIILASNLRANMDDAFSRRLQSTILFAMPDIPERLALWEGAFKDKPYPLAKDVDLPALAKSYAISGGGVINVLRYACLKAVVRDPREIRQQDLITAIRRELQKDGRMGSGEKFA